MKGQGAASRGQDDGADGPAAAPGTFAEGFAGALTPGKRPVVVAVDMMSAYFDPDSPFCLPDDGCLGAAAQVIAAARTAAVPVIHTIVRFGAGGMDGGIFLRKVPALRLLIGDSPLGQLMPQVDREPDELVLVKQYASAFFGTTLAPILQSLGADTVVLVGVSTSGCIRASAVDALQHGFVPLVVREAVGDREPAVHEASLYDLQAKYAEVISLTEATTYLSSVLLR